MIKPIFPEPVAKDGGGTDFKTTNCSNACYVRDEQGQAVNEKQCQLLSITANGLFCLAGCED